MPLPLRDETSAPMHARCAATPVGMGHLDAGAIRDALKPALHSSEDQRRHFGIDKMDVEADIITINGIRFDGAVFRQLTKLLPVHEPFRIVKRDDGVLAIERIVGIFSTLY